MNVATLGIDLGKTWCSLVGLDGEGAVILRRKLRRERVVELAASLGRCRIGIEATRGSHHLARALRRQGHDVRLMPPAYVKAYVKSQKNDDRDAEAIAEAVTRPPCASCRSRPRSSWTFRHCTACASAWSAAGGSSPTSCGRCSTSAGSRSRRAG